MKKQDVEFVRLGSRLVLPGSTDEIKPGQRITVDGELADVLIAQGHCVKCNKKG